MKKTIVKANNIVIGREIEVEIVDANYNETSVEVKIMEGVFAGKYAIVSNNDIVKYEVELPMIEQVAELCEEMNVEYSYIMGDEIEVEGYDYKVYIFADEELNEYTVSTLNLNIDWEAKEEDDIYFCMLDAYKNKRDIKTLKGLRSYIEKYIG